MSDAASPARVALDWQDPLLLREQLTGEERLVMETVRQFAREQLLPRVGADWRRGGSGPDIFPMMGGIGLLGMGLPEAYGGAGASRVACGLAALEIESVDSGYRSMMSVQSSLVMYPLYRWGSESQKRRYLPGLARGGLIGCFGLTEPGAGSDPGGMRTVATRICGGYRLSGVKTWITGSPVADIFLVWARSAGDDGRVRGFVLEKGMEGLSAPVIGDKLGLQTSVTGEIVMTDVEVSGEQILPGVAGLGGPFSCLDMARHGIAWGVMGAARTCWLEARNHGMERQQFGRPLAATQLFQKKLADMQTEIALGLQAALRVGRLMDSGSAAPEAISMIKRNNCGKALEIARNARDMLGGSGIQLGSHVMRHAQNLDVVNTYEGTHDIHALILGRAQTGIPAF